MKSIPGSVQAISVVVPSFNGAAYIGEALQSVIGQTRRPNEVVVVDDASTDGTPERVAKLARTAPFPIRMIRLEKNSGGPARPLNVGIAAAAGACIAVLDQDDVFASTWLEEAVTILESDDGLGLVFGYCGQLGQPQEIVPPPCGMAALRDAGEPAGQHRRLPARQALELLVKQGCFVMGYPGFVFRGADWKRKGGADEQLRISSDYDFLCWLCTGGDVAFLPRIAYWRRDHAANLCRRGTDVYVDILRVKCRYVLHEPWLLEDHVFRAAFREDVFGLAYWLREAGRYGESLSYYRLLGRWWGWDARIMWALAKHAPHWFRRRLAGRAAGV